MEPEETTPSKGKRFLKIALVVLAAIILLLGTAYFLTALKHARQAAEQALTNATESMREPTEAEKLAKAQSEELDRWHATHQTASTSLATTTIQQQTKALDILIKKMSATAPSAPKTIEQQNQELDAWHASLSK